MDNLSIPGASQEDSSRRPLPAALLLMGPTASGKTDLAIALSRQIPVEIISVDSALVYRGMDIGSAKPDLSLREEIPHHLVDIRDPSETYSVAEFRCDALAAMDAAVRKGKVPLLVGGTMMYFKVLLEGLAELPASDTSVRQTIEKEAARYGWPYIHEQLAQVDPEAAERIHPLHSQRLCRALEVYRVSGKTLTSFHQAQKQSNNHLLSQQYNPIQIAISPRRRATLHQRINQRFEAMLEQGLIDEVRQLMARGDLHGELPSLRAVGYRQVWEYLSGTLSRSEMLEKGKAATRQLAKRQLTWLRGWDDLRWIYTENEEGVSLKMKEIVTQALNFIPEAAI